MFAPGPPGERSRRAPRSVQVDAQPVSELERALASVPTKLPWTVALSAEVSRSPPPRCPKSRCRRPGRAADDGVRGEVGFDPAVVGNRGRACRVGSNEVAPDDGVGAALKEQAGEGGPRDHVARPAALPPTIRPFALLHEIPVPLDRAAAPVASTPMKLPRMLPVELKARMMPGPALPEMMFRSPAAAPPMVLETPLAR